MKQGTNRRLANVKTRRETGLEYVMFNLDLNTPFGKKQLKEIKPYYPGEEEALRGEFDRVERMIQFVEQNQTLTDKIQEVFMEMKDPSLTVQRSDSVTLSTVELYEIKMLLLQMRQLRKLTIEHDEGDYRGVHCKAECDEAAGKEKEAELLELTNQAEEYIASIEKSELRIMFRLYYIDGLTWVQVAHRMNRMFPKRRKAYTEDSCRMRNTRFFEEN